MTSAMLPSLRPVIAEILRLTPYNERLTISDPRWDRALAGAQTLAWCDGHDPDSLDLEAEAARAELLDDALNEIADLIHDFGPSKLADKVMAIVNASAFER